MIYVRLRFNRFTGDCCSAEEWIYGQFIALAICTSELKSFFFLIGGKGYLILQKIDYFITSTLLVCCGYLDD